MAPKQLKWWLQEYMNACGLACFYKVTLTLNQFCACRGLEEDDRDRLRAYFDQFSVG